MNESASGTVAHERVVVTGAGSGIGRAVSLALAETGITVFALGRRVSALEATAGLAASASGRVVVVPCDTTDDQSVAAAFDAIEVHGPATALVNAAAQMQKIPAREMTSDQFREVVASTLFGTFSVVKRWASPLFTSGSGGAAVLLTSNSASRGTPGVSHSSAGKAGVEALTKSLAREWGPYGIRLNAVGPGAFPVEKSARAWSDPSVAERMTAGIALGRYGALSEIVAPIVFLLTAGAGYITGQTLRVDGGLSLTRWSLTEDDIVHGFNNDYTPLGQQ